MSDNQPPEENLLDEFRKLGNTLANVLKTGWERPERKKLQNDIESGLKELGETLKHGVEEFESSSTGQTLKSDFQDFGERFRSGEVETRVREEILNALRNVNNELQKVAENWSANKPPDPPAPTQSA